MSDENEPRKAVDVLLSLESKIDQLVNLIKLQDLNNKLLSNKLNSIISTISNGISVSQKTNISNENLNELFVESDPIDKLSASNKPNIDKRVGRATEIIDNIIPPESSEQISKIPVVQRVIDSNGKAVFLAGIEIFGPKNKLEVTTRTNGTGKWQASLSPGKYKIIIKKAESASKQKIEISQDIVVPAKLPNQEGIFNLPDYNIK